MSSSKTPGSTGRRPSFEGTCEMTPGPLGVCDAGDPLRSSVPADTPGPLGVRDEAQRVCLAGDPGINTDGAEQGAELFVFDAELLLKGVKGAKPGAEKIGAVLDANTLRKLMQDFGFEGITGKFNEIKVYSKPYKGKDYVIFKGYPGLRKHLKMPRYLADDTKVLNMAIGKRGLARSALRGGRLTIVVVGALDVAEYVLDDDATLASLGVTLLSDLSKAAVGSAVGAAVGMAVAGAFAGVVVVPVAAGLVAALIVDAGLTAIDRELELTEALDAWANERTAHIERETNRWWNFLNSPAGMYWLQRRLSGY